MFKSAQLRAATFAIAALLATSAQATNITGAGSSFVFPVLSKWSAAFHDKTSNEVNYQSIGSGGGIAQIKAATVDFGASDAPLSAQDLQHFGLGQFPVVVGGIVPIVHVAGVKPGQLKLTGNVLAQIYLGGIKTWNDPQIAGLNPGVNLPAAPITVVHRSDGSGTSFNFSNYLSKVNKDWQSKVGFSTTPSPEAGATGASLICTEKDIFNLRGLRFQLRWNVAAMNLCVAHGEEFLGAITQLATRRAVEQAA